MIPDLPQAIQTAIAEGLGAPFSARDVRVPARGAAAAVYVPPPLDADALAAKLAMTKPFPRVLGATSVSTARVRNGWLLFTLDRAFYAAAAAQVVTVLPMPDSDLGSHALNRMRAYARHAGCGCPDAAGVQRALLLALCLPFGGVGLPAAERAALGMFHGIPPRGRAAVIAESGGVCDAISRIFFDYIAPERRALL